MRSSTLAYLLFAATLASTVTARFLSLPNQAAIREQKPVMNPGIVLPPSNQDNPPNTNPGEGGDTVILSDVLGRDRSINVFAGLARDIVTVSDRINNEGMNTTLLAPVNSAITSLPRKPWEDTQDYNNLGAGVYQGDNGVDRAHKNLQHFVESHVVPSSPWSEGEKVETMAGQKIWWESKHGVKLIQPGGIEVSSVASTVANGEVWILKGVMDRA